MDNPLLLAILPLSRWNRVNRHCETQSVFLPLSDPVLLRSEGRSIDLLWTPEKSDQRQQMIGMLYMERFFATTNEEVDCAIQQVGLYPDVIQIPAFVDEEDIVFVYFEWFEDLDGWMIADWMHLHAGLVRFMSDLPAYVSS